MLRIRFTAQLSAWRHSVAEDMDGNSERNFCLFIVVKKFSYVVLYLNLMECNQHFAQVGNHIDVASGKWTAQDAGIGAGVDSYFEYLVKGAMLLQKPNLMQTFHGNIHALKYINSRCTLDTEILIIMMFEVHINV
jgi:Glycosyl hydrolase family 47